MVGDGVRVWALRGGRYSQALSLTARHGFGLQPWNWQEGDGAIGAWRRRECHGTFA